MLRTYLSIALSAILLSTASMAQNVNGKVKATGDADLHVIRLYADSFPQVSLTFQAQSSSGTPVWNLQKEDVRVEENDRQGKITSFRLLSQEEHLQTMLVIDHSGSMARDWRYWNWYNNLNWDSIPYTDTIRYYFKAKYAIPASAFKNNNNGETSIDIGPTEKRDTFYLAKREPVNPNYHSPLWYAQQGAKVFLKTMSAKDSTGLIGFSDFPDLDIPLARNNGSTLSQIDNMYAGGATAFFDAVDQSLNHLVYHRGLRAIVALTDGADNSSRMSLDNLIAKAKKMHCPIYIIGLGDVDQMSLERLTNETGGELFLTNDATKLQDVFLKISHKLQSVYELVYESPFLKSSEPTHELQLRFDVDSMFLNSQLIDLPLPESVITHLAQREAQQASFQQSFPIVDEDSSTTVPSAETTSTVQGNLPTATEFPYETLGVTFLAAGAGVLVYRKTQRKEKQSTIHLINVFPNPTTGPISINYETDGAIAGLRLVVMDDQGIEVYSQDLSSSDQSVGITLENFAAGLYFVRIESTAGVSQTKQVVLQH